MSDIELIRGILIPFFGTSLGAACVFLIKQSVNGKLQKSFTGFAAGLIVPALPYLFGFAAGAMMYVVVEELIPEISQGKHTILGSLMFILGFTIMMMLDVALG